MKKEVKNKLAKKLVKKQNEKYTLKQKIEIMKYELEENTIFSNK